MNFDASKNEIIANTEEILRRITTPAKAKVNGKQSHVCPLCGHGKNGDGLTINPKSKDGKQIKCFGCGFSGDIIALIGEVENIADYPSQIRRAGEFIGLEVDGGKVAQKQPEKERESEEPKESFVPYYKECQRHLGETGYFAQRGISAETLKRFMCGYDAHYTKSTGGKVWGAVIIPTGVNSYVARNTDPNADDKNRYRKVGNAVPFNIKALGKSEEPLFITEGELDALSIIEVGGEAIGLGSTSNIDLFIDKHVKKNPPNRPFIVALDNDKSGESGADKLEKRLKALGLSAYREDPYNGAKDANEALVGNREAFRTAIAEAVENVKRMEAEKKETELEEYLKTSTASHLQEFVNGIAESVNTPAQRTGFANLDNVLDGGLYEGLYILGAITSLGKTTLALQIADQIAESGRDVLIFSLEMARTELMSKSISRETLLHALADPQMTIQDAKTNRGITTGARYKNYSEKERELINLAIEAYSQYADHIFIHEGIGNIGTDYIRTAIQKHKLFTGKAPVVLVDYIQILAPQDIRATDKQNTDKAVLELKRISRDFKIPLIGISSLNRAGYSGEVTLADFKESGAIEYGSDVLIGLQFKGAGDKSFKDTEAKRRNPREVELVVLKNRNGKTGERIEFEYYPLFNRFKEV